MGIIASYNYRGIPVPPLYFRLSNIVLTSGKEWNALLCGFKDRDSSLVNDILGPAFTLAVAAPYIAGIDPYAALYAAVHEVPAITEPIDVLVDPPPDVPEDLAHE